MALPVGGGYTPRMKLALSARIKCDPRRILADRWVHDTAHDMADSIRKALKAPARKKARKR